MDREEAISKVLDEFVEITAPLLERVGRDGMEKIALFSLQIAHNNWPLLVSLLEKSPALIDRLSRYGDKAMVMDLYHLAVQLAGIHPSPAMVLLDKSPDIINRIGFDGFMNIAHLADKVARFSWRIASRLIEKSPYLADSILKHGHRSLAVEVYNLADQVAQDRWEAALGLLDNTPAVIDRLSKYGDQDLIRNVFGLAGRVARDNSGIAVKLIEKSPNLIEKIGYEGLEKIADVALQIAEDGDESVFSLLEKCPDLIDRLLDYGDQELVFKIYDLTARIAMNNARVAIKFCEKSPELIDSIGSDGLDKIAHLCSQLKKENWEIVVSLIETSPDLVERIGYEGLKRVAALCAQVGKDFIQTAVHMCNSSPEIIDRVGYEGLKYIASFCVKLARDGSSAPVRLLEKSPGLMDRLLRRGDSSLVKEIYNLTGAAAHENPRIAISLLEKSPDIFDRVGLEGLMSIADLSLRIARDSWTTADSLIKISTDLIDRIGYDGLKKISDLSLLLARQNVYGAVSLLEKSPALTDGLLKYGNRSQVMDVLGIGADMARVNWTAAVNLLEKSPELIERVGLEGLKRIAGLSSQLARKNSRIAVSLLGVSPDLIDRVDFEGLTMIAGYCTQVAQAGWESVVGLLNKSADLIDRLLEFGDRSLVMDVYRLVGQVADSTWKVSVALLEKSPDYIELAGYDGLEFIARRAQELANVSEENAISFARGESIEFADFMENIPKGLELKSIKPILSNYLMALLGYRVEIEEGESISTDGHKIYLPKRVREFQDNKENFVYYKVISTHQEAHLEYGSFDFEIKEVEDVTRRLEKIFGKGNGVGSSEIERFYHLFPEPELARDLINVFEDFRIETRLKKEYPVLGEHICHVNEHNLQKRSSLKRIINDKQRSVEAIGRALIAGKTENGLTGAVHKVLQYGLLSSKSLCSSRSNVHDAVRTATDLYLLIYEAFKEPYRTIKPISKPIDQARVNQNIGSFGRASKNITDKLKGEKGPKVNHPMGTDDGKGESSGETNPSSNRPRQDQITGSNRISSSDTPTFESQDRGVKHGPAHEESKERALKASGNSMKFFSANRIEKLLKQLFKEKGITPKEIESKTQHMKPGEIELFLNRLDSLIKIKAELEKEKGTFLYPEWGVDIDEYRENWARIREQELQGTTKSFYRETVQKYSGLLKRIRREFQMLKPEELVRLKGQYDGDEIDLDAAVEYFIDRKIGLSPSEKNYMRTEKNQRDIAVVFLIDMSRSTKGAIIQCEKEALIIMSEALSQVGDAFAIFGFSGDNRDNVDFYRIKVFEENYNQVVRARISEIDYRFENRDGSALRHTVSILRKREEKTKLIILLSDGKPVDKEYSGNYAIEDTRMALLEAQKYGVNTFCITVDKGAAEYLPRMYSHSSWVVIDDVNKLPEKISRIYGGLTH